MLKGRTAVVTGASRGIGRAIALEAAKNGADIAVIYGGNGEAADETAAEAESYGVKVLTLKCDVSDFAQVKTVCETVYKTFQKVDILVNNAGITRDGLLLSMSEADFDAVVGVNLKGAFNMIRHLSRYIMKSPCGRIINISSVVGLTGNGGQANYAASKAGLIGLTKTTAKELAGRGVTCNAVAPGFIETDMTAALSGAVREKFQSSIPLKRMGTAREVASLALFLASDAAAYITGEVIKIDGGMCV
jgi:3-oxoacyl-[acyl-carrier protein] reductase